MNNTASAGSVGGKTDSASSANSGAAAVDEKTFPKDARVMMSILKDMGISDFEPRVVNQLLEFSYRYVSTILEDSKVDKTIFGKLPTVSLSSLGLRK